MLATLRKPGQFLLCGDSNQIVHPNFFSWSKVKSLFWRGEALAQRKDGRDEALAQEENSRGEARATEENSRGEARAKKQQQELNVLRANFRNGREATRVANTLLKIKNRRFGSIDRESNFLVEAVGGEAGAVTLLPDEDAVKRDLDRQTRQSTQFAVLVMRDEDKTEARAHFRKIGRAHV